jgi:aryl-alcohol dehydrogenase-like predicted oxidoreductase
MILNRRTFLASTLASVGGAVLVRSGVAAELPKAAAKVAEGAAPVNPFEIVPLGKTGLKVSRISCGTGMRGSQRQSNQTRMGEEKFGALLKDFYDRGGRFFDMADLYGSMPFVGKAMKANRDQCVYLTKIWTGGGGIPEAERPDASVVVERFRKELQTDVVDVVLIHCQMAGDWADKQKKYMDSLEDLKAKKLIRAHGVSVHSLDALKVAAKNPWVDVFNVRINHAGQNMDGPPDQVAPILKEAHENGKGIVGMKLCGEGKWANDPDARSKAVKFVLGLGTVDAMTVGFEKVSEIEDFQNRVAAAMKELAPAKA